MRRTDRAARATPASDAESAAVEAARAGNAQVVVHSPVGGLPTRFCPDCYARNPWEAAQCEACGAALDPQDDFATRLIWALGHPETGVAVSAAATIAARHLSAAIGALRQTLGSPEVYRAAAAAEALTAFMDVPEARVAVQVAQRHPSVVVRRAVEAGLEKRDVHTAGGLREPGPGHTPGTVSGVPSEASAERSSDA